MSAHTVATSCKSFVNLPGGFKMAVVNVTGSASYDTNGSNVDLSTSGNLGSALGFRAVNGAVVVGYANGTTTNTKWMFDPILGTSGTGTTITMKVHDITAASDAEVSAATDLSALVVTLLVIGT